MGGALKSVGNLVGSAVKNIVPAAVKAIAGPATQALTGIGGDLFTKGGSALNNLASRLPGPLAGLAQGALGAILPKLQDLATGGVEKLIGSLANSVTERFAPPAGYVAATVCSLSGRLAGPECPHPAIEFFAPGSAPVASCPYHKRVHVDRRNGLRASADCPAALVDERPLLDLPERYEAWARRQHLELAPREPSPPE